MSRSEGTRGEFFTSIIDDQDRYPALLTNFFDQFSILYNIIGEYDNLKVDKDMNNMTFTIHAPSAEVADGIILRAKGEVVQIYNKTYSIHVQRIGPTDLVINIG